MTGESQPILQSSHAEPIVRGSNAMPVGVGIRHRQYVPPSPKPPLPSDPELDLKDKSKEEWIDKPSFAGQMSNPAYWKVDKVETRVFDFSDTKQMEEYSALMSKSILPDSNFAVVINERQFCAQTGNWKVLVELQYVKFRKLLKKEHEQAI
jgi:hypothetical protein